MMIRIRVKPNSSEQGIEKIGEIYLVKLKSRAEDGKANLELVKLLSKYFGSGIRIKSGFSSRNKIIELKE